jgi:hypothetical protein
LTVSSTSRWLTLAAARCRRVVVENSWARKRNQTDASARPSLSSPLQRIASQLNYQTQLFLLAQQYQALQAHALVAQQQQQQQQRQIGQTTFGTPSPAPSSHQPLPSPSPSHYSECSASSSSSSFSGPTRYSPYARSSGGSDSLAPPFDGQHAFRSEKQARVNSAAKARRARGSSSASSASSTHGSTSTTTVHGTVVAPLASPAQSATSIARDTSMSPPPVPSPTTGAVQSSTAPKRAALSDLLGATTAAYAVSVRETAVQESFLRGGDDASSE